MNFAYLTYDAAKTSIKHHIYHYTAPREMEICDSGGVTMASCHTDRSNTIFLI
jgi:hypothetical protein